MTIASESTLGPSERGSSLLGILIVVLVLGVMAAYAVSAVGGTNTPTVAPTSSVTSTTAGEPANVAIQSALTAACVADYQTLSTALQVYATLHNANPPAGTSWATGVQSGSSLIQSWPSDPGHFTLTWNGTTLGVVPRGGAASSGSAGSTHPPTGCYAPMA